MNRLWCHHEDKMLYESKMIYEGFLWHPYFGTDFQTTVCQQNLRISEKFCVTFILAPTYKGI